MQGTTVQTPIESVPSTGQAEAAPTLMHQQQGSIKCSCFFTVQVTPPIVARIEYVAGRVPAASATQITSLKPYHGAFSGTVDGA
jgi:hypothetical protein